MCHLDHGVSNEVAWRVSLVPRPLYRAFIPPGVLSCIPQTRCHSVLGIPIPKSRLPQMGAWNRLLTPLAGNMWGRGACWCGTINVNMLRGIWAHLYIQRHFPRYSGERGPLWKVAGNVSGSPTMLSWIGTRYCIFNGSFTSTYDLHKKVSVKAAFISEFQKETITLLKYSQKIPVTVPFIVLFKN